ncbi:MAG: efflux RND transporter periplasmic adaptor subunit [Bryobacterales bacterium]|nr:efflux RND transporter periplasmic adaptor subunit [Bryobacterales bacterium]
MNHLAEKSLLEEPKKEGLAAPQEPPFLELPPPLEEPPARRRGPVRYWIAAAILAAIGTAGFLIWRSLTRQPAPTYSLVTVNRGNIFKTITATGKVQAVVTVQVGTQVSGTVSELHADFNDRVRAGEVIARLDPSQFQAQYNQAVANLHSAQARVETARSGITNADAAVQAAEANVERAESVVNDAQVTFNRTNLLMEAQAVPRQQLDSAKAALTQAVAQKAQAVAQANQAKAQALSARAQLEQAQADVKQADAAAVAAKVNLDRSVIRAPIDGVVVSRNVDVGQTVAASLQSPTLFLIANDLTHMQVLADVDEADVGQLRSGDKATFTVDAFPRDTFNGKISSVRLAPQVVQNVTTYTAVIDVENPDLKLKPGMTANITATVDSRQNVLLIPNTALRFRPQEAAAPAVETPRTSRAPVVWKETAGTLQPVRLRLGLTDGVSTEVVSGDLQQGDRIAVPMIALGQTPQGAANPLNPMRGGRR